ncbi:MAG: type IV pilus secretin PilQ [Thermoanaerobaculia bacterium]
MAIAAVAWVAAAGCAARRGSADHAADTSAPAAAASSASATSTPAGARITDAAFNEDGDGARVVLSADAPLLYTSYEPRPDLLVFDFPGVEIAEGFTPPTPTGDLVRSVQVESITEMGKKLTRVTIGRKEAAPYQIGSIGREGLAIAFASGTAPAPAPAEEPVAAAAAAPVDSQEIAPQEIAPAAPIAAGEPAHTLEEISARAEGENVAITLLGDGVFSPRDFVLANPPRIVVDLPGVKNEVTRRVLPVGSALVSRVRVSQFQTSPLVTRIVVDLAQPVPHSVRLDGERLALLVGTAERGAAQPPGEAPAAVSVTTVAEAPAELPAETADAVPDPAPVVIPAKPEPAREPEPAATAPVETVAHTEKSPEPRPEPIAPASVPSAEPPPVQTPVTTTVSVPPPPAPREAPAANPAPAADLREGPARPVRPGKERGDALFEAAAAMLAQEELARPTSGDLYQTRTLAEQQTQFTGEPISLDLKDADIKDVFRTISQLTGLNIVIDPEVRGTVTVQLEDVPWDQALDLILKQNGLGYVLENNIMHIATTAKLQSEQADRARLAEARQAAEPTRTVIKKLSYARAGEITQTLKSVMSRRGDIVVDSRTNTLIIREIPTYLPAVLQLIENLDTSTPQVMIESRIVETTKTLGRSLGINWGFNAIADVAHGNTTNLVFPNNLDGAFRVGLENGPIVGAIRLGNILDTFNLDIALTAAENQGLLKIISSPKVTALTNTPALIQSGVQIPVQTNVNNTTTVIYVDATLRLQVTPQITSEGTILLDVAVQKREPAVALNIALGQNVPLRIQEYRGQILVRDGGTTVIGGIFQINDQDQNNMIPGLWKIPILGNLFRNKTTTQRHDELLIFITPRILRS